MKTTDKIEKACFNMMETSKYIGLGITKTQQYIRAGIIPSRKIGRQYLVFKKSLDEWLAKADK